jgi:hypothetical protein
LAAERAVNFFGFCKPSSGFSGNTWGVANLVVAQQASAWHYLVLVETNKLLSTI